jgi:hypothetical protein
MDNTMDSDHDIEAQVESLCGIITGRTAEFWEERNKAILDLTVRVCLSVCPSV